MAISVSKANALTEMVKAFDSKDIKKANKIGSILCKSIQSDAKNKGYSEYIQLDRETKQLFPVKLRKSISQQLPECENTKVRITTKDEIYEIVFSDEVSLIHIKQSES